MPPSGNTRTRSRRSIIKASSHRWGEDNNDGSKRRHRNKSQIFVSCLFNQFLSVLRMYSGRVRLWILTELLIPREQVLNCVTFPAMLVSMRSILSTKSFTIHSFIQFYRRSFQSPTWSSYKREKNSNFKTYFSIYRRVDSRQSINRLGSVIVKQTKRCVF